MGKGADKSQRDRRKATAPELARKAALRTKADDGKAAKEKAANSAALKIAHEKMAYRQ